jgi:hypothetical protein
MLSKAEKSCKFQADLAAKVKGVPPELVLAVSLSNMRSDGGSSAVYYCHAQGLDPLFDQRITTSPSFNQF